MKTRIALLIAFFQFFIAQKAAAANHILKFEGIPVSMAATIKRNFPFVFEREVNLSEVDTVMRSLMSTQYFSSLEVVERSAGGAKSEYVMIGSLLRKITAVTISGNSVFSRSKIQERLKIETDQTFERKELLAHADELQVDYADEGYLNPQIDIDFETPTDSEVKVHVSIKENSPCIIKAVNVETANPALRESSQKFIKNLIDTRLSQNNVKTFENNLKEYFSGHRFLAAKLSTPSIAFNADRTEAKLTYLIENPQRYEFIFDGNVFFSEGALISAMEVEKILGLNSSPAPDLADRVRKLYEDSGFANVNVEYKERVFDDLFKDQIRLIITEGERVRIKRLVVSGEISRPPNYYSKFIKKSSSKLTQKGFYNRRDIEAGYKSLLIDLQNQGFIRAKVQAVRTEYSKDKQFVDISINLEEGPLTQIRDIVYEGATAFTQAQLNDVLKVKKANPLSLKDLEESIGLLKDFYRMHGFLEMKILNEDDPASLVTYNSAGTEATLNFTLQEGPKIQVAAIEIQGNSFTKTYVIARELEFKVGDTLTPQLIDDSVYRLQKLQLFSEVQLKTLDEGTMVASRIVVIKVTERDPGLIDSGVGLTNEWDLTYRGFLGVAYKNLAGTNRGVSARADLWYPQKPVISFLENRLTLGYFEPYVFGDRTNGRVNLTREQRFWHQEAGTNLAIINENNSAEFLLERDLSRHLRLSYTTYNFTKQKSFYRTYNEVAKKKTIEVYDIGRTGPTFELDYRDNAYDTRSGQFSRLSTTYADPVLGSSRESDKLVQFIRVEAQSTRYTSFKLDDTWTWVNHVRGGMLDDVGHKSQSVIPPSEIFVLGGPQTIRGFSPGEEFPRLEQLGVNKYADFRLQNQSFYYLFKSELRVPIGKVGPFGLAIAPFYDAGGVILNQSEFYDPTTQKNIPINNTDGRFRNSAGIGLRWMTPVGPFNVDLAFKLPARHEWINLGTNKVRIDESDWAVHLSFGNF